LVGAVGDGFAPPTPSTLPYATVEGSTATKLVEVGCSTRTHRKLKFIPKAEPRDFDAFGRNARQIENQNGGRILDAERQRISSTASRCAPKAKMSVPTSNSCR